MADEKKPTLFLVRPDDFDGMIELVRRISGREATAEELADAKVEFAKLQEKLRQPPSE